MCITKENIKELVSLYETENNITHTAKKFCKRNGVMYNDVVRRKVSRLLNKHWENTGGRNVSPAKVLIFDIETMPMEAYVWSIWQNVNLKMLKDDWYMLSWSAKWLFEDEIMSEVLTPKEVKKEDDYRITKKLWDLFNEADIIIAHNGKKFDVKRVNTRFLKHKLSPPMPYILIDTLLTLRKKFAITSNKLDYIATEFFGFEGKIDTGGFDLWRECKEGNKSSLKKMREYNEQDVYVLEEVYLRIRPWIQPHPNMGLYIEPDVNTCPTCGGHDLDWEGSYMTYANKYDAFRCNSCGSIGRSKTTSVNKESKEYVMYSIPT